MRTKKEKKTVEQEKTETVRSQWSLSAVMVVIILLYS